MVEIINSLRDWKEKGKGYPTQVQIHLTNYCNLNCIFCPTKALIKELKRDEELKREEWLRIIHEGNELGVKEWHLCGGGEPLLFTEDALAVMESIKSFEKYGEIITNGTFFREDVSRKVVEMGWDKIYISLDSPFPHIQDSLRGGNCFSEIIAGVRNLVVWKKKLKKEMPEIYFHTVICNKNYKHVLGMIKLAKKLGVQGVVFNALNIWQPEISRLELGSKEKEELMELLKEGQELANRLGVATNVNDFLDFLFVEKANVMNKAMVEEVKMSGDKFASIACYYPWYNISIFPDGRALPCFILKDKGESTKEKGLKEIWLGEYFNEIRRAFLANRLKEDCSKCNPWNLPKMKEIREKLLIF